MLLKKDITLKQWLFGDFDNDGVKNIDDPKPGNPKQKNFIAQTPNTKHYYRARYGGGEVLLSEELKEIAKHNDSYAPLLNKVVKQNPGSYGRIKTVPSTLRALRTAELSKIQDVAGITITTNNREKAYKVNKQISKKYRTDPTRHKDFYKNPVDGYYAIHNALIVPESKNKTIELQIKSKKMAILHGKMHPYYKSGKMPKSLKTEGKRLFKKGY